MFSKILSSFSNDFLILFSFSTGLNAELKKKGVHVQVRTHLQYFYNTPVFVFTIEGINQSIRPSMHQCIEGSRDAEFVRTHFTVFKSIVLVPSAYVCGDKISKNQGGFSLRCFSFSLCQSSRCCHWIWGKSFNVTSLYYTFPHPTKLPTCHTSLNLNV